PYSQVVLRNIATAKELSRFPASGAGIGNLTFSPKGDLLVFGDSVGVGIITSERPQWIKCGHYRHPGLRELGTPKPGHAIGGDHTTMLMSPNGKLIAIGGTNGGLEMGELSELSESFISISHSEEK